ncbi:hypothetical protein V6N13_134226 [Hibiscus sabdariffa]|uniref:Leucine-rich repeat-containing N-terminal plant-type domain-containing protein n=1 Tax=Hibiscus sabdariffa TaxID=183260 RepID=A0ABR2R372_9ROSI
MVPLIVLALSSLLTTFSSSAVATSLLTDFHVLITLKKGFQFPEPFLSSWNSSNPSSAGNNFTGSIEIANLSEVRFLNISNNQFNCNLDWNYASIANLEVFDAYNNNFTALLPVGVLGLKKLSSGTWILVAIISTGKSRRVMEHLWGWSIFNCRGMTFVEKSLGN